MGSTKVDQQRRFAMAPKRLAPAVGALLALAVLGGCINTRGMDRPVGDRVSLRFRTTGPLSAREWKQASGILVARAHTLDSTTTLRPKPSAQSACHTTCDVLGTVRGPAEWEMLASTGRLQFRSLLASTSLTSPHCVSQIFGGQTQGSPWYLTADTSACDRLGPPLFPTAKRVSAVVIHEPAGWAVRVMYRNAVPPTTDGSIVAVLDGLVLPHAKVCAPDTCRSGELVVDLVGNYSRNDAELTAAALRYGPLAPTFETTTWDRTGKSQTFSLDPTTTTRAR